MTTYPKDIETEVVFIPPENGGRRNPIVSGLRPLFFYDGTPWIGTIHFDAEEQIPKGEPVRMYFAFLHPQSHVGRIVPGKEFQLLDGSKVIANGRVLRLIDLERSASQANQQRPSN